MEKNGGGDQRYWSAKAATLDISRKYLHKCCQKYLHKFRGSPEIAQQRTLLYSPQVLLLSANQVEELLLADVTIFVRIEHDQHVVHL